MYDAVRSLYSNSSANVRLNGLYTNSFSIDSGVRQGDVLSPTLFALYINDLVLELNGSNMGVKCGAFSVACLLYADDLVIIADSEHKLQSQINAMYEWCRKWRMQVNINKSKIVHFRKKSIPKTRFKLYVW